MNNTERQAAYKERMRTQGKRQLTVWVSPEQAEAIKSYLAGRALLGVAPPREKPLEAAVGEENQELEKAALTQGPGSEAETQAESQRREKQRRRYRDRKITQARETAEEALRNGHRLSHVAEILEREHRFKSAPWTYEALRILLAPCVYELGCRHEAAPHRDRGASWTAIAKHLNDSTLPPPDGKGRWNRVRVQRLFEQPR